MAGILDEPAYDELYANVVICSNRGFSKLAAAMAHVHIPQATQPIDVLVAVGIPHKGTASFHPNLGMLVSGRMVKWVQQMIVVPLHTCATSSIHTSCAKPK